MGTANAHKPDPATVLTQALLGAGDYLGLSRAELGTAIGKERTVFTRGKVAPDTKAGELALMLIRCYRSLYALVGGDRTQMQHWMHTRNSHTGGVPAEQVKSVQGLVRVMEYLDAIRGKI
jgi:hypothetical protein